MAEFESHSWEGDPIATLRESNSIMDYLPLIQVSDEYNFILNGNEIKCNLKCCKTFALSKEIKEPIYSLLEVNMRSFYESTWGWDRDSKTKELFSPSSYFITLTTTDSELVAFAMFKFSWDDEDEPEFPVLFCYELQVAPKYQGCGVGKMLVEIQLKIAKIRNMWKTMLTCFKINCKAMQFYLKSGFGIDANSPSVHSAVVDYEILSDKPRRKN